jgi:TRAP-type C4-dicarboxylate transport system substrate-binding protein
MNQLAKTLDEKSDGLIKLRIYAGGIAGDELDVLKKIRIGQIHCAAFSGSGITQILPMVRVLDLPFLFRNSSELDAVQKTLGNYFSEEYRKAGFEFLGWAEVGDVHIFSKKAINRRDDLSKLKIWTWTGDPVSKQTFAFMGNSPIVLSITDVTTALNTNMIDTVYGPPLGVLALQWYSYVKYMTALPIAHSTGAVLISKTFFDSIPDELAVLIKEEFNYTMAQLASELKKQSQEAISIIQKSGVEIIPIPDQPELENFYTVHDSVAQELSGEVYPKELLERIYSILGELRSVAE